MNQPKAAVAKFRAQELDLFFGLLRAEGYRVIAPTVQDGAIVYDSVESVSELPKGWTDEQEPGKYRLKKREDTAFFGYTVGPQSWKRLLQQPRVRLWRGERDSAGIRIQEEKIQPARMAFIGVRSCELHAIARQDRILIHDKFKDSFYEARREETLLVAVNCGQAGGTCFCVSMETGPKATTGFDLALTEFLGDGAHEFLVEVGTERGRRILEKMKTTEAGSGDMSRAEKISRATAAQMGRKMRNEGIRDLLYRNYEHPRWDEVAQRCLNCANCTMVCPTCFCTTTEDVTDLTGDHVERWRHWDSCFTLDHSYIHGGNVRASGKSRYRQWMTHKLATWYDQFQSSGCVGCGRCITWCPVGIDITEEVAAIRATDSPKGAK